MIKTLRLRHKLIGGFGIVLGLTVMGFGLLSSRPAAAPAHEQASSDSPITMPLAAPEETKLSPWRLNIPSIGVDTAIQEVGLMKDGRMNVPSNYKDVGWYSRGPRPGQVGNAVIAGHLNGGYKVPAVFENLHKLKQGDVLYIKDEVSKKESKFKVTGSESYNLDKAPLDKIFGESDQKRLNLITCSGNWDKETEEYNQRLVVFTELIP